MEQKGSSSKAPQSTMLEPKHKPVVVEDKKKRKLDKRIPPKVSPY